jgi:hypothetical protein
MQAEITTLTRRRRVEELARVKALNEAGADSACIGADAFVRPASEAKSRVLAQDHRTASEVALAFCATSDEGARSCIILVVLCFRPCCGGFF